MTIHLDFDEEAFLAEARREVEEAERGLAEASFDAARAGVWEAQQDHPYTDRTQRLTNTAHPERSPEERGVALMVWEMPYASFVDSGTSRSRPYPFTPQALRQAERTLLRLIDDVITNWGKR